MTKDKLTVAKRECKRFLALVADMERAEEELNARINSSFAYASPKHRGFVRRSSMDLTRSLADLRRR